MSNVFLQRPGLFFYLMGMIWNIAPLTSHCSFILFVLKGYLPSLFLWRHTGHFRLFCTQMWVFFWELWLLFTRQTKNLYLCCMLFLFTALSSQCYYLNQNCTLPTQMTRVRAGKLVKWLNSSNVGEMLVQMAWLMYHFSLDLHLSDNWWWVIM